MEPVHDRRLNSRIMLVDDEITNLKLLKKMLNVHGYSNLDPIQDPREVIPSYREHKPDLILLDLNMPYIDGYAVIDLLKELHDPLPPPIVVLTAQRGQEHLMKALNMGVQDFITKPFDMFELLARVRNMLDIHASHRMIYDEKEALDEQVKERTAELLQTRLQIVQKLGRAAEYRDNETGKHILRVSHMAALFAGKLQWSDAACETILHATPMHDIGKIGIPDAVLLKPGKLNAEEWEQMKTHTTIGAGILDGDDSELLDMAREIALSHHEKWDGSGYPAGLQKEEIPYSARIVSIADVFDALVSKRVYKDAWQFEKAIEYIQKNSGRHFDPALVAIFTDMLPQIMEIMNTYHD